MSQENSYYGNAMSRNSSLIDKFFTGEETTDFGLNEERNNLSVNTDGTFGIQAKDYFGDSTDSNKTSDMLSGISLGGIGSAVKGVASIWEAYNKKEYQDKIFGMEEKRVARQTKKEDDAQAALNAAWS